nr:polyadenylate-binding protein 2-like [Ipomoea batatas]
MNPILTTVGAVAAVAKVASTAYYYAEHFGVLNRESKADQAETRSVEAAEKQSADVGFLLSRIPVFHGSGYEIWSSMMKTFFVSQDLWDMVEGGYIEEELTVEVLREVRKKDAIALLFIQQAIDQSFFSCIAGACKSKEAWDALANKYQGDVLEPNQQSPLDLPCPADAIECREEALEMESRGYTDEPNQKAVDELVLSYAADATDPNEAAWDAPEQGYKASTKVVEASRIGVEFGDFNRNCGFKEWRSANSDSGWGGGSDDRHVKMSFSDNSTPVAESAFHSKLKLSENGIGKESGDVKNNNSGSKKGSNRGGRGGRNCGRFNNSRGGRGGRDGECSNNQGFHGGTENGDFNNSLGGRGGQGSGHINNNRGGRGGRGSGHINNNRGGRGGKGRGHINNNRGGRGGKDHGHFNKGSEAADYYSKNAKSESASSCTTSATETKEALDAHALQQGHQANTEVLNLMAQVHAHPQVSQSLTTLLVCDLDVNVTDRQLFSIFRLFGQVVSYSVCRDMASQCSLGYGYVTYGNPQDAALALTVTNLTMNGKPIRVMYFQQDSTEHKSGGLNSKKSNYGGIDGAHSNNNQDGRVGTDGGCFNNKDSKLSGYTSKNPNFESVSSCSTDAIESKEASDAPQLGHQANTEVKDQAQVGNPSGGTIFIKNLDRAIDDRALHAMFSAFGNILSCKVETDASGQSKGYGRIKYDSEEAAREAIEKANGKLLNGKKMYVEPFVRKQGRAKAMEMTNFTNVFVGNLSVSTTEKDLREVFGNFGTIVKAVVVKDGDGKSEGFGFVNFNDAYDAAWSVDVLNGHEFDNKVWSVQRAYQKKNVGKAQKKFNGKAQKKSVDESVPSSTAKATGSKKSGDTVSQKKCNGKAQKKYVPSSTTNETESKKAVEAVQKGFRANTIVLYVDDKGVGHFRANTIVLYVDDKGVGHFKLKNP